MVVEGLQVRAPLDTTWQVNLENQLVSPLGKVTVRVLTKDEGKEKPKESIYCGVEVVNGTGENRRI